MSDMNISAIEPFSTDCPVCNASESSEVIEYNEGMCESCAVEDGCYEQIFGSDA